MNVETAVAVGFDASSSSGRSIEMVRPARCTTGVPRTSPTSVGVRRTPMSTVKLQSSPGCNLGRVPSADVDEHHDA